MHNIPILNTRNDGQIGDGVYIAYDWIIPDFGERRLCRIYIGTKISGPILQYDAPRNYDQATADHMGMGIPDPNLYYNGRDHVPMTNGAWTTIYSRGNFGRKYAYGGNWSGHCRNLHPDIQRMYYIQDESYSQDMVIIGDEMMPVPPGVAKDGTLTSIDCSPSWAIWFSSAADAMRYRLTRDQWDGSTLPAISRKHLSATETHDLISRVMEVINAYKL